jgi:phosphoglycolate phosphatase
MAKLILFDVDGTLIRTIGNLEGAWNEMLSEVFGIKDSSVALARREGKTEREIVFDAASEAGVDQKTAERKLHQAYRVITEKFSQLETVPIQGAMELLDVMKEADEIKVGLLTGNSEERGWNKLEKAGMRDFFRFGVFSNDAETREDLFQVAIEKAEGVFGMRFDPKDVWIIGDTPRDVSTAVKNGAKCIAVTTGPFKERELISEGADFVLKDLTDYKRIISIILGKED